MLNEYVRDLASEEIQGLLVELREVNGFPTDSYDDMNLGSFLDHCQTDGLGRREPIEAAKYYTPSLVRTKVGDLPPDTTLLVRELCGRFQAEFETVISMQLYVFLNRILNEKSKLRKRPRIRL